MTDGTGCTLITGGAVRIGKALSLAIAEQGVPLAIHCHSSREQADELVSRLSSSRRPEESSLIRAFRADFSRPESARDLLDEVEGALGPVERLILSAAAYPRDPVAGITDEGLETTLRTNMSTPFMLAREAGLRMRGNGRGSIVALLDWSLDRPYVDRIPYTMAKAGLRAGLLGLARALAPQVRVNAVAPGAVLPPADMDEATLSRIREATLVKKIGSPRDVVEAVLYLLDAGFVTGTILTVDGGRSLR